MDQLVQLERVDLAGVKPDEAFADVFEQLGELLLVIVPDELLRGASFSPIVGGLSMIAHGAHSTSGRRGNGRP